ncbi:MAG: 2-oxo acid dehydrogenase subunit E2 [Acidobacteriota bacterium]|jgi:pyruvate dehydrogenase E2 component (dihydrolipoamide acetyltransferase)
MTMQFMLPELGEHVESAELIKILVSIGTRVEIDQPVLELETDKADFELPSAVGGVVKEIHVREGERVKVGQLLFTLDESAAAAVSTALENPAPAARQENAAAHAAPEQRQPERETRLPALPASPIVRPTPESESDTPRDAVAEASPHRLVPATPTVRRLARELGIDLALVGGSGPAGRILAEDVKAFAKRMIDGSTGDHPGVGPRLLPLPDFSRWGDIERKDITGIRRKIAASMSYSWSTIPHVTNFESVDITDLEQLRKRFSSTVEAAGGKLTITSIAVKVISSALKVFPSFAASLDVAREQIILKKYYHIGVAVDTDRGLIVPVIRDADKKNILQLSVEIAQLAEKARSKKITLKELEGAVFTITNLGGIGGTQFSPIIHAPEVAILGISRARHEAIFVAGKFEPRLLLPISLSYDHRLIDGADASRFLRWVVQAMEQPFLLPLEG